MEVGIDTEVCARFKNKSERFLNRVFAKEEIAYAKQFPCAYERLCAFWCVKEAVIKALSTPLPLSEICTLHDAYGRPYLKQTKTLANVLKDKGIKEIKISISHSGDRAIAICIIN